jgi:hypothetical protein
MISFASKIQYFLQSLTLYKVIKFLQVNPSEGHLKYFLQDTSQRCKLLVDSLMQTAGILDSINPFCPGYCVEAHT